MPSVAAQMFRGGGENALIFPQGFIDAIEGIGDGGSALRIPVLIDQDTVNLPAEIQLDTGTWLAAAQAMRSGTAVELAVQLQRGGVMEMMALVPLQLAQLDKPAYQNAVDAATQSEEETPAPDAYYVLTGGKEVAIEAASSSSGISIPWYMTIRLSLGTNDVLKLWADPNASVNGIDLSLGQALADDVVIDGKTVAVIKTERNASAIYKPTSTIYASNKLGVALTGMILTSMASGENLVIRLRGQYDMIQYSFATVPHTDDVWNQWYFFDNEVYYCAP